METSNDVAPKETADGKTESEPKTEEKVAYSTYSKVLDKLKQRERELAKLNEEVTKIKDSEVEKSGNYKQLVDSLRERNSTLEDDLAKLKKDYVTKSIHGQIKEGFTRAGCIASDKMIKLLDQKDFERLGYSEDGTVDKKDLQALIDDKKKDDFYLFQRSEKVNDLHPSTPKHNSLAKDISKMSYSDKKAILSEMLNNKK
jgi:hypothetical protein